MSQKILIFSLAYYPSFVSGAEAAVKEITDRIAPRDIAFHLLTLRFDATAPTLEQIGNVTVHRVGNGGGRFAKIFFLFQAARAAKKLHQIEHFTGMWGLMTYMSIPITFARLLGLKQPYVMTLQDGDPYDKVFKRTSIKPFVPFIDRGFRNATVFQVISNHLAKWPATRGYRGPVVKIYNGANPAAIKEDSYRSEEIETLKAELGKKPGEIWLVNTARLVHQKAFDVMIRSLTFLPPQVKCLVVGQGEEEQMLKALVTELRLEDRVIFTGQVDREVVTKYRLASDIFVMPSRSEGLGNSGLSALASRLPFITTAVDGLAEYSFATDTENPYGRTAWVVPVDDAKAIADAVQDIIAHPDEAKRVADNARAMVVEVYNWDIIAKRMQSEIFNQLQ
ncbi:MAG: glycosyltransferase family 4 protein [Patescibacteria group bacterium]